jgi:hypothetical protein
LTGILSGLGHGYKAEKNIVSRSLQVYMVKDKTLDDSPAMMALPTPDPSSAW